MIYVVDASAAVKWYVPEQYSDEAELLLDTQHELFAPELILPEVGNIIWKKVRRAELTEAEGNKIIKAFQAAGVVTIPHTNLLSAAYTGAVLSGQTVYDWTYLALALSLNCEFVTADEKFYRALEATRLKRNLLWVGDLQ
ncbi:MAG: type II toxin-antitoxin system VapC family toxin [Pyrinomonadaceae bacterium]|nr:type II toxin-antitoxin system VapC family toxin [Pyrinomonadaceae bacterium]